MYTYSDNNNNNNNNNNKLLAVRRGEGLEEELKIGKRGLQ